MTFLTDFADQAVILPLSLAVALLLAGHFWWRGAAAWVVCVGSTLALIGLGKLLLAACGPIDIADVLRSPSGHTGAATVVYGGVCGLAWRCLRPTQWLAPIITSLLIAGLIGISRVVLHTHSWAEVVVGGAVGLAGVWALLSLAGRPPPRLRLVRLVAVAALVAGLLHGTHLRAEADIQAYGRRLAWLLPGCNDQARP